MTITVAQWVAYDSGDPPAIVGGLGGWFGSEGLRAATVRHHENVDLDPWELAAGYARPRDVQHRWKDYLESYEPDTHEHLEAIRAAVLARGYYTSGGEHQSADDGVPLFSDGTAATYSMRGWGDLMAAIRSEQLNEHRHYMDFYMDLRPDDRRTARLDP